MPRARLRDFGPEEALKLVAASATLARRRKHGQQRQPPPVMAVIAKHGFVARADESERSESLKPESARRGDHARGGRHPPKIGCAPVGGKKGNRGATLIEV